MQNKYTANMVLINVMAGWKTTGLINYGSAEKGTYQLISIDVMKNGTSWDIKEKDEIIATARTLKESKTKIANYLNNLQGA